MNIRMLDMIWMNNRIQNSMQHFKHDTYNTFLKRGSK